MSQHLTEHDELVSDVVACQLVIKQILDVIDVIAPVEVREKMTTQLKAIDFASHPASADPVTLRAVQKAIALIELKFTPQEETHKAVRKRLRENPDAIKIWSTSPDTGVAFFFNGKRRSAQAQGQHL